MQNDFMRNDFMQNDFVQDDFMRNEATRFYRVKRGAGHRSSIFSIEIAAHLRPFDADIRRL